MDAKAFGQDSRVATAIDKQIGGRVRARRMELGISQTELSSHRMLTYMAPAASTAQ